MGRVEGTAARYRIRFFFLFVLFFQKEKQTTRGNGETWQLRKTGKEKSRAKLVGSWLLKGGKSHIQEIKV